MPQVVISIGGRSFEVACQEGEESYLQQAASLIDAEATVLTSQIGRMPESQMLLMASLMLADKTVGLEDKLKTADAELAELRAKVADLESRATAEPERIEVPYIPESVTDMLKELATRAEDLADQLAKKSAGEPQ
ncbi:cell division protein ZapA [Marivivens donghaensis]|uniref:Cell division protein ZapA n=1 Tax=Marivivens donghaensis TaxID=1699413 RepID=A0ABX0VZ34_9RHOB|nr:cell division protein ZapA [Marivivens donghaensis]NIY73341.1 cell division protein ZapA [Marivivens donghaensis]